MDFEATMGSELEDAVRMDRARWSLPSLCAASTIEARRTRTLLRKQSAQIAGSGPGSDGPRLFGVASTVVRPHLKR